MEQHKDDYGRETCAWCGLKATGFASIGKWRYCHGDLDVSPTCYERAQQRNASLESFHARFDYDT